MILWKNCTMSDSYFNNESNYSEENASDSEDFHSNYLQPFQFEPEKKKSNGNHKKETKHSHASRASQPIYQNIRIGNVDWCKCGYCKKEVREIDCLCCRELDGISDEKFEGIAKPFVFTWIMKKTINTLSLSFGEKRCEITLLRSSHQRCSVKKGVLRNFTKFTGKRLRPATLLKKSLWILCDFLWISWNL